MNRSSKVVDITSRRRTVAPSASPCSIITQERLQQGLELVREQMRLTQALREYSLALEKELVAGATIEPGDLDFDREVKVARRRATTLHPYGAAAQK